LSETEKFDAIIIGAGPAGSACAYTLAKAGKSVLVIERADTPGAKNVSGGRLYSYALEMVDKSLTEDAALERKVTHEQIMMISRDKAINIDYLNPDFNRKDDVPHSYTILRAKFDQWFAGKAEELGAMVICGIRVDDLIVRDGKVVGVIAGEDEMLADVVVAADGVNSFIARKAGLVKEISSHDIGVGVKEIIELPSKTIEERFNLKEDEGTARVIMGCTEGVPGGGFLYTNKESISLGAVFFPEQLAKHGKSIHEIFQELKMHPAIYPLIEGGETVEYGAHLVSEAGYRNLSPTLYREGLLVIGEAAGFVINTGATIRGMDLAILSGLAAAKAIIGEEDSAKVGPAYLKELNGTILPSMKAVGGYKDLLEIPTMHKNYPNLAADVFGQLFTVDGKVPASMKKSVPSLIKANGLSLWQLVKDGIRGFKAV
jgi:electron transfer flavoprotein-quinone oxidoreductase